MLNIRGVDLLDCDAWLNLPNAQVRLAFIVLMGHADERGRVRLNPRIRRHIASACGEIDIGVIQHLLRQQKLIRGITVEEIAIPLLEARA